MAYRHISLPQPFAHGDPKDWFKRFEICCRANAWDDDAKAAKLPTVQLIRSTLSSAHPKPQGTKWFRSPLQRNRQLWPQLSLVDGIVYCCYAPGPTAGQVTFPIIPTSLHKEVLCQLHDSPTAGHLGADWWNGSAGLCSKCCAPMSLWMQTGNRI